jgi:RNA polymerase sigma factor (sigma-70 family)
MAPRRPSGAGQPGVVERYAGGSRSRPENCREPHRAVRASEGVSATSGEVNISRDQAISPVPDRPPTSTVDQGLSDEALIRQSVEHPEQFAHLFDRHAPAVHRYLARRIGGHADDLLSETFLVAFRQRRAYQPQHVDVRPWLYGIATNLLRRHVRTEERRCRGLARAATADGPRSADGEAEDRLDAQALRRPLAAALAKLKRGDRDVLLLMAWADLSYAEIAAVLDIPIGTVRSRLNRARRLARGFLAPMWTVEDSS